MVSEMKKVKFKTLCGAKIEVEARFIVRSEYPAREFDDQDIGSIGLADKTTIHVDWDNFVIASKAFAQECSGHGSRR